MFQPDRSWRCSAQVFTPGVRRHPGCAGVPPAMAWMRVRCPRTPEKCEHVRAALRCPPPPTPVNPFPSRAFYSLRSPQAVALRSCSQGVASLLPPAHRGARRPHHRLGDAAAGLARLPGRVKHTIRIRLFVSHSLAYFVSPEVKIWGNRVSPPPSLRGGARFPPPAGEGQGGGGPPEDALCSSRRCAAQPHGSLT